MSCAPKPPEPEVIIVVVGRRGRWGSATLGLLNLATFVLTLVCLLTGGKHVCEAALIPRGFLASIWVLAPDMRHGLSRRISCLVVVITDDNSS